jgi:hypothetical protein
MALLLFVAENGVWRKEAKYSVDEYCFTSDTETICTLLYNAINTCRCKNRIIYKVSSKIIEFVCFNIEKQERLRPEIVAFQLVY